MHGRLHDDIEELPFACLRVDSAIVPSFDAEDNLQHVRDGDVTPLVLVGRMESTL